MKRNNPAKDGIVKCAGIYSDSMICATIPDCWAAPYSLLLQPISNIDGL
jgi:hypothetical protein